MQIFFAVLDDVFFFLALNHTKYSACKHFLLYIMNIPLTDKIDLYHKIETY